MKNTICTLAVVVLIGFASPVDAQIRDHIPGQAPVQVFEPGSSFTLGKLFNPEFFQMRHSYSLSYGSVGGSGMSMGEYTNSLNWRFSSKLAARVDVGFQHTPFGTGDFKDYYGGKDAYGKVYIPYAEVVYRPTDNSTIQFSMHQSQYGPHMSPYGRYGGYGGYGGYNGRGYYDDPFASYGNGRRSWGMRISSR